MKRLFSPLLGLCLATTLLAQVRPDDPPLLRRSAAELEELLGPIALYPDALVSLILPASTYPSDIVLGARFVAAGADPALAEGKAWDASVKALTRYPETLTWLDENLEWATQVGDAFIEQPVEVMEAIQELRARACALGNLIDTPEQRVIQDDAVIRIIPAQPQYIYEPRYDPEVVYYERAAARPQIYFSIGYGVGSWLNYDCDWRQHRLYRGDWHQGWDYRRDAERRERDEQPYITKHLDNTRQWQPDPARHRAPSHHAVNPDNTPRRAQPLEPGTSGRREHQAGIARPKPIRGAPSRDESVRRAERPEGKPSNQPPAQPTHENKNREHPQGHVAQPRTAAPGISDDGKRPVPHAPAEAKKHAEPARHEASKPGERESRDIPRKAEAVAPDNQRPNELPRHRQDAPRKAQPVTPEAPQRLQPLQETPKNAEAAPNRAAQAPRHQEPQRQAAAPQHPAKPQAGPAPTADGHDRKKKKKAE
ncbi:MAG: DUF3300 domain-containing protein [Roseimicrobium sp.]